MELLTTLPDEVLDHIVATLGWLECTALAQSRCMPLVQTIARRVVRDKKLNARQTDAVLRFLLGQNLFLTGIGGSGKSYVVNIVVDIAREVSGANAVVVAASTSAAANQLTTEIICVRTLHSLLNAREVTNEHGTTVFVPRPSCKLLQLRLVVLDEVSMSTHELYDLLISSLHPDCQVIACGDLLQLPPVGPHGQYPHVFLGRYFKKLHTVELIANIRASGRDEPALHFRAVLSRMRLGRVTREDEAWIRGNSLQEPVNDYAFYTKNKRCREMNVRCFAKLPTTIEHIWAIDEMETVKWNRCLGTGGEEHLARDSWYYRKDDMALAKLGMSVGDEGARMMMGLRGPVLTQKELGGLRPPANVPETLELRIGMRVVITRAIWSETDIEEDDDELTEGLHTGHNIGGGGRHLVAANGDVGDLLEIMEDHVTVRLPPWNTFGTPRDVVIHKVAYRNGCPLSDSLYQRIWVRRQLPLQIGYAITAHKAQGTTLSRPVHMDVIDVYYTDGTSYFIPPSIIYVILSRARHISQIYLARDEKGRVFRVQDVKPDPRALEYHLRAVAHYHPLSASLNAVGGDDEND